MTQLGDELGPDKRIGDHLAIERKIALQIATYWAESDKLKSQICDREKTIEYWIFNNVGAPIRVHGAG